MNDIQKLKRNFRQTKAWKEKKAAEKKRAGNKDEITGKPLRKGWQMHHQDLNKENYTDLSKPFLCCNNLTHKFIHWLWTYYRTDVTIIDRLKAEMEVMAQINCTERKKT